MISLVPRMFISVASLKLSSNLTSAAAWNTISTSLISFFWSSNEIPKSSFCKSPVISISFEKGFSWVFKSFTKICKSSLECLLLLMRFYSLARLWASQSAPPTIFLFLLSLTYKFSSLHSSKAFQSKVFRRNRNRPLRKSFYSSRILLWEKTRWWFPACLKMLESCLR